MGNKGNVNKGNVSRGNVSRGKVNKRAVRFASLLLGAVVTLGSIINVQASEVSETTAVGTVEATAGVTAPTDLTDNVTAFRDLLEDEVQDVEDGMGQFVTAYDRESVRGVRKAVTEINSSAIDIRLALDNDPELTEAVGEQLEAYEEALETAEDVDLAVYVYEITEDTEDWEKVLDVYNEFAEQYHVTTAELQVAMLGI